jgi:Cu+-exporting ATPase
MSTITLVKDPVCGMDLDPAIAAGHTEYKGQTYYFCAARCKEIFDIKPERYLA